MRDNSHPNERLARIEERVDHLEEEIEGMSGKVNDMHAILLQAKGVRWIIGLTVGAVTLIAGLTHWKWIVMLGLLLLSPVLADGPPNPPPPHFHPSQDAEIHDQFYSNWMRPAQPTTSCCDKQDCAPVTHVRRIGDRWEAQREKDGAWLVIPPHAIEQRRDSPDGRSHLCSRGVTVFCFVAGAGT